MYVKLQVRANEHTFMHTGAANTPASECVFVQVNVMSVISQGFDYRPEEVLCSQAARKAARAPAQAPQPLSQLTAMPVSAETDNGNAHK